LIQSFAPGEVTPEQAHEIGKKLAAEILKGEYGFVLATHVDRGHVHNHFVWCAANVVTHKKYRSNKNTYHEIRRISNKLCKENELSVIKPQAKTYGKSYDSYRPDQTSGSWRQKLQNAIDSLIPYAKDFDELLKLMEAQGYKVKRGKYVSFCAPGQERFTRAKSIGDGYTEEAIKQKILRKPEHKKGTPPTIAPPIAAVEKPEALKAKIDIAGNQKFAESPGLRQWASIQNLQNTAKAFILMMEYGGLDEFNKVYADCRTDVDTIENGIKANNERLTGLKYLREDVQTYHRTRPVYTQYREMKRAKDNITFFGKDKAEEYRNNNESDITAHENARRDFNGYKTLPKVEAINAEIAKIKAANVNNGKALSTKKAELKQLGNIHDYLHFLQREHEPPPPQREPKQHKRNNDLSL